MMLQELKQMGNLYCLNSIILGIEGANGYASVVECNVNSSGTSLLYQIYLCIDRSGSNLIDCLISSRRGFCVHNLPFLPKNTL
ncbi:Ribonuclease [Melia azedarach]|uniref:Ribonuclease n=1 Tax=Melia azedarach TaxID=155640 RepID=A0ACC1XK48_MELAZ|nr:Ribonuclease [Melia azedarach]